MCGRWFQFRMGDKPPRGMNWPGVTLWEPTVTPRTLEGSREQRERAESALSQTRMVALMDCLLVVEEMKGGRGTVIGVGVKRELSGFSDG